MATSWNDATLPLKLAPSVAEMPATPTAGGVDAAPAPVADATATLSTTTADNPNFRDMPASTRSTCQAGASQKRVRFASGRHPHLSFAPHRRQTHDPSTHPCVGEQLIPQSPQLFGSLEMSKHV